ncbi:hypothetical protein J2Y58_004233 [Sphingomonas sp. BE138]|uniref:hypothetical protein n=1 Tax=Sphingomonas sp. BE138 TaxID=2817845 RepID=UPI00285719F9|nr:hypothetical protein [Sphingomonas sp. BE138]MDR6790845.1 hypothetical protein [Sphingomonas sp. BE138]
MIFALLTALVAAAADSTPPPIAQMTAQECPAPSFDKERGDLGDRAIIADDGSKIVVQCGDGVVRFWQSGSAGFTAIGKMPLFRAAQERGIVSAGVLCPWSSAIRDDMKIEADCDVIDHSGAGGVYILQTPGSPDTFVVAGSKVLRESTVWQRFGGLRPKDGQMAEMYMVNGQKRPELLQAMALDNGRSSTVARLPSPSLVFEDGEGSASDVLYSPVYRSVIVSFGGAFRVAREMTYLRAFDEKGRELWAIKGNLPPRDDSLIVGDFAKALVFGSGRYALLAKTSDRSAAQVIDLKTGESAMTLGGWPIAAARGAAIVLMKGEQGTLSLVRVNTPGQPSTTPTP